MGIFGRLSRKKGSFDTKIETTFQFEVIRDGKVIHRAKPVHNVTTEAGRNVARQILHQAGHGAIAGFDYITVGSTNYTPLAADVALTGEVNAAGLERAAGTYSSEAGVGTWKLVKLFTYTGAGVTIYTGAVFNAATGVTMAYAALFGSSAVLATNDQLQVTVTGTISAA